MRSDKRPAHELRSTTITPNFLMHAEGSVLIESGNTRVICSASVEDRVPPFLRNSGKGWVTAVQLLIDGKEVDTLSGHVDLRRPLVKNLAWVQ